MVTVKKKILKDREGFAKMRELYIHFLGLSFWALFYAKNKQTKKK